MVVRFGTRWAGLGLATRRVSGMGPGCVGELAGLRLADVARFDASGPVAGAGLLPAGETLPGLSVLSVGRLAGPCYEPRSPP